MGGLSQVAIDTRRRCHHRRSSCHVTSRPLTSTYVTRRDLNDLERQLNDTRRHQSDRHAVVRRPMALEA